ncbi:abortive infection family protein [Methanobacterium formicicum]|uniref:DUF7014 domain-containing protein n=1 Tax=Methanobacterium formicicum (strain DSM 3637 / PP1) TaxID=1204725 RepID=K2QDR4_METFP|nr:abortive infection family protein [Methanobacterium formicicum]EKF86191.1 hypothetical protein A994_04525 [Methanobacterium formicicum DSM 3637]
MLYPIRDLFFRRMERLEGKIPDYYSYDLDNKVRFKIINHILDNTGDEELSDLIGTLRMELGREISDNLYNNEIIEGFLYSCDENEFLSAIEILISLKYDDSPLYRILVEGSRSVVKSTGKTIERPPNPQFVKKEEEFKEFINIINEIFRIDKIGYEIVPVSLPKLPYIVVPFNSQYLYVETIREPLLLLNDTNFRGPLNEFERALDDYRYEKYDDAIHKANKSYESTLKTILKKKNHDFNPAKEKISTLVQKVQDETDIIDSSFRDLVSPFFSVLKKGPNIIRNMEGIGHGQGVDIKEMEKSYADFVLRLTGTYIVFLIERYNEVEYSDDKQ